MIVCTHSAPKKTRKSLEEWKEVDILEPVVKPRNDTLFAGSHWVFQQALQLTRLGQHSSGYKITFQSSSLPRIGPQEALLSTH
ncbi:unnamed protein product [Nezara viridula]|uniref:Uncharacterized protein n=1 Tax=Nezara viridula TaxID=85310 RepID=A0A9P0E7F9_NEZVI|nr:unnamed protein product [Nezara viridula]